MKKNIIKFFLIISLFFVFSPISVLAQTEKEPIVFKPQVTIPGSTFTAGASTTMSGSLSTIGEYIKSIYNYLILLVGLVAVIASMIGGVIWLTAAGNTTRISTAKSWIGGSLTGLVLALSAYLILKTINPNLTDFRDQNIAKIDPITLCCNEKTGLVNGTLDKDKKYICPTGATICGKGEKCTKLSGKETWQCLSEQTIAQTYRCCEYIDTLGYLTCVDEKKELTCPKIEGKEWRAVYEQVLCDIDGTGRTDSLVLGYGGKCYYPGPKKCCQCRFNFVLGIALNNSCVDNYSEGACDYWCGTAGTDYVYTHTDTTCKDNGYCR